MSDLKLYIIDVSIERYQMAVVAESPEEAIQVARENASDEELNFDFGELRHFGVAHPSPITHPSQIPTDLRGTLPYGPDDHHETYDDCEEFLEQQTHGQKVIP